MNERFLIPAVLMGMAVSFSATAEILPYIGGTVGRNFVDTEFDQVPLNFDDNDNGWSAFAGLQLTENFGVEASYNKFGGFSTINEFDLVRTEIDAELTGFDVFGVLSLDLGLFELFGKAGVVFWDTQARATVLNPIGSPIRINGDNDGNDFAFGAGIEVPLTPGFSLRGEYEWFDIEETNEVSFVSVGLSWRF